MIRLVVLGLLCSVVVINAAPPQKRVVNVASEARRLVHQANWAAVGTISTDETTRGFPMVSLLSTSDSKVGASSTGDIFFYMMDQDLVAIDVNKDNKISFMFSDAQEGGCNSRNVDPWSHACARTIITGKVTKLDKKSDEYSRGLEAFVSRHPSAANWESIKAPGHSFYLCKLDISNVLVFSQRGYQSATPEEYYAGTDSIDVNEA